MSEYEPDVVVAPATFTVTTVIPYTDEPEYREYTLPSDELPLFLEELDNPQIAERVINVEPNDAE